MGLGVGRGGVGGGVGESGTGGGKGVCLDGRGLASPRKAEERELARGEQPVERRAKGRLARQPEEGRDTPPGRGRGRDAPAGGGETPLSRVEETLAGGEVEAELERRVQLCEPWKRKSRLDIYIYIYI